MRKKVTIYEDELIELCRKADLYEAMVEARRRGADKINNISPEARKARAKKAADARWHK